MDFRAELSLALKRHEVALTQSTGIVSKPTANSMSLRDFIPPWVGANAPHKSKQNQAISSQ